MPREVTTLPVSRETMLRQAYANAAAAVAEALHASEVDRSLIALGDSSPASWSFAASRDAAQRLAGLWNSAARQLAILEAVRGLSDPATYGGDTSAPAVSERGSTPLPSNLEPGNLNADPE